MLCLIRPANGPKPASYTLCMLQSDILKSPVRAHLRPRAPCDLPTDIPRGAEDYSDTLFNDMRQAPPF